MLNLFKKSRKWILQGYLNRFVYTITVSHVFFYTHFSGRVWLHCRHLGELSPKLHSFISRRRPPPGAGSICFPQGKTLRQCLSDRTKLSSSYWHKPILTRFKIMYELNGSQLLDNVRMRRKNLCTVQMERKTDEGGSVCLVNMDADVNLTLCRVSSSWERESLVI